MLTFLSAGQGLIDMSERVTGHRTWVNLVWPKVIKISAWDWNLKSIVFTEDI